MKLMYAIFKKLILAWDPDFTKLTPAEAADLEAAKHDELVSEEDIDWDAPDPVN